MTVSTRGAAPDSAAVATDQPDPLAAPAARSSQNGILGLFAALFALVYLRFWPQISTTMDESSYLGFAYVLRHGTIYADKVRAPILLALSVHGHLVSKYPMGMSALLSATSLLGWSFALGTNLIIHLLTYTVVIRVLRRLGLSPYYALLYLLHPTAVLYSRTVMSDLASGLVLALAFEQYLTRRYAIMGALLGVSILLRTANAVALPLFLLGVLIEPGVASPNFAVPGLAARLRSALGSIAGSLPFVALAAYYSAVVAGGQMAKSTGSFGLTYFPRYFPGYALALMLIYPGMLLTPALYRGRGKFVVCSLCYSFVVIYSFWYFRDQGGNMAESLIVGQRYFLAVLPLYIVSYGMVLSRLARSIPSLNLRRAISVLAILVLAIVGVLVQVRHAAKLKQMISIRDALVGATTPDDLIYCNTQIGKLLVPWSDRQFTEPTDAGRGDSAAIQQWLLAANQGARSAASDGVAHRSPRLVFASWVREGRSDDKDDGEKVSALARQFDTVPVVIASAPELHVWYIIEGRAHNRPIDPSADSPVGSAR